MSLKELKAGEECVNAADYADRTRPFHTMAIDTVNGFDSGEHFPADVSKPASAYVTWDQCDLYLGYQSLPSAERASPHKYLVYYIDTDPLGDDGTERGRAFFEAPRLPIKADYLVTIRMSGAVNRSNPARKRNAQIYKYSQKWNPGLTQSWQPWGREALMVGGSRGSGFVEAALDRAMLGQPCAVQMVGWVVNTDRGYRRGFWPIPSGDAVQTPVADSSALDYYGFPLVEGMRPNIQANLNRIDYSAVGECARGDQLSS